MTKQLRACPICKNCGAKKFSILYKKSGILILECKKCFTKIKI